MQALRRRSIAAVLSLLAPPLAWAQPAAGDGSTDLASPDRQRLALGWRRAMAGPSAGVDQIVYLKADWQQRALQVEQALDLPSRAHGLLALPDGGCIAVATRPGGWLLHLDARGRVAASLSIEQESPARTLNGHAERSADGHWLYTTETDPADGSGWVSLRDARSLRRLASWPSGGCDPHHLLLGPDGRLWVANGGIPRDREGRPIQRERMDPSLAEIDPGDGQLLSQLRLQDPRLSLRHLALSGAGPDEKPLLGVGLQAEHADAGQRQSAPLLAVVEPGAPRHGMRTIGMGAHYSGDIATGPLGGFVLSAQKAGAGLWWRPQDGPAGRADAIARLGEPCALAAFGNRGDAAGSARGVLLAAARGLARWQIDAPPAMLPWPHEVAPDNHMVLLAA